MNFDQSNLRVSFNPSYVFSLAAYSDNHVCMVNCEASQEAFALGHLHQPQQSQLRNLINSFPDVLTKRLGRTNKGICHLELNDTTPCRAGPYMLAPPKLEALRTHVNQLLQEGIIVPTISDYASPCFLVPKKDGGQRLVIDYRKVNSKIIFDTYPLPTIESALMTFGSAKFFTILDLNAAYHQIPLSPQSQRYTTFTTPFGTYAYTRLPFGLTVGSQVLSRILANLFSNISWKFLFLYLDDLLIFSNTFEEHLHHLSQVLSKLRSAN